MPFLPNATAHPNQSGTETLRGARPDNYSFLNPSDNYACVARAHERAREIAAALKASRTRRGAAIRPGDSAASRFFFFFY